jgi:hypothetical protein
MGPGRRRVARLPKGWTDGQRARAGQRSAVFEETMDPVNNLIRPIRNTLARSHQAIKKLTQSQQGREKAPSWKPTVEALEGRDVPSTTLPDVDLSTRGATGEINGAIYTQYSPQPTGTGYINSFLRVQGTGRALTEQGYNTDARPLQFNELKAATFTHSLRLSDVPQVSIGGVAHYAFMLDINQSSKTPLLSLDQLRIFSANAGNLTGYDAKSGKLAGLSAVYDLDRDGDHWVKLNAGLNPGSGRGDMMVYVPASAFAGSGTNPYVYLFCRFGDNYSANGGFEEWATVTGVAPPVLPPPTNSSPASLSGSVYDDNNWNGVMDSGEVKMSGITVTLTGVDEQGNNVQLVTTSDAYGKYSFTGLMAGTYTVTCDIPIYYTTVTGNVGSTGGISNGALLGDGSLGLITLKAGDSGVNYNFGAAALFGG